MAKKLLSEMQVRRFAKLANLSPINEMYSKRDEEEMEEAMDYKRDDEEKMEEGSYMKRDDEEVMKEEESPMDMDDEPEMDMGGEEEMELTDEEAQAIIDLGKKLEAAMPAGEDMKMDDEPEMDMDMGDEPDMDMGEEEEIMEALAGINYIPEKKDIVEEVARRVAKRLLKAKKADQALKEALGNKK